MALPVSAPAPAGSTVTGQSSWVNSGFDFLNSASSSLTGAMNSIGSLFSSGIGFASQIKDLSKGNTSTYTPVGATASASASSGGGGAVNPMVGGIPVLPFALGGAVVLGFVLLLRK